MKVLHILAILLVGITVQAQSIDPDAKRILDKTRATYEGFSSFESSFSIDIEFPEEGVETMNGVLIKKGNSFKMKMDGQEVLSDGSAVWVIMHASKEVQINDIPDSDEIGFLSPQTIFSFYESGEFSYRLAGSATDNGKSVHNIEFTPVDRDADFYKIKMNVDKSTNMIVSAKVFIKDGSRYTFKIRGTKTNGNFPANFFAFDKTKYNGYYIEDLRE